MSSKISTHSVVEYLKVRNSVVSNIDKPVNSDHLSALLEQTDKLFMSRVSEALAPVSAPTELQAEQVKQPAEQTKHPTDHHEHNEPVEQRKPVEHAKHAEHVEHVEQLEELAAVCVQQTVEQTKYEATDQLVTFAEDLMHQLAGQLSDVLPSH